MLCSDLTTDEQLVLAALVGMLLKSGDSTGGALPSGVNGVVAGLGEAGFASILHRAAEEYRSCKEIEGAVQGVLRQPARELMFTLVKEVADSLGISAEEMPMVGWLEEVWEI